MDEKQRKIEFICNNLELSAKELAYRLGVSVVTVYGYLKMLGIPTRGHALSEHEKYLILLRKLENNPGIIEAIFTDMEFNLPQSKIEANASRELGITTREARHIIHCVIPSRSRSRWKRALNKRQKSNL